MIQMSIGATVGAKVKGEDALPKWRQPKMLDPESLWAMYEAGKLGDVE